MDPSDKTFWIRAWAGDTSSQIVILNICDKRNENLSLFGGFPLSFFATISETKTVRFEIFFSVTGTWYIPPGGHPLVPPPAHQFANTLNLSNPHCDRLSFRNSRHTPYSYQRRSPPGMTTTHSLPTSDKHRSRTYEHASSYPPPPKKKKKKKKRLQKYEHYINAKNVPSHLWAHIPGGYKTYLILN